MQWRARRGAVMVLFTLVVTALLVAVSTMSIDVSRLTSLRNELQSAADAGAHAGAIQLLPPFDPAHTSDSAKAYVHRNGTMQGEVTVDSLELGEWNEDTRVFTPGAIPPNAVRVVVSHEPAGLMVSALGVVPRVKARAIGWAQYEAPVTPRVMLTK